MNDVDPDYVIAGETNTYNYQTILKAVDLINKGARLIATNSDLTARPSRELFRHAAHWFLRLSWLPARPHTMSASRTR